MVEVLTTTRHGAVICDKVTMVYNQSWIGIHAYVIEDFYWKWILDSLEQLTDGASVARFAMTILDVMTTHGGLCKEDVRHKLVSFGADGTIVFHISIQTQFLKTCPLCSRK